MVYLYFKTRRNFWTLICKLSAFCAGKIRFWWLVSLLDFSLSKRAIALSDEATYCMNRTAHWQNRAKLCVLAHHENEKALKKDEEKAE